MDYFDNIRVINDIIFIFG